MRVQQRRNRIPRRHRGQKPHPHTSQEAKRSTRLADPSQPHRSTTIPGLHRLLPILRLQLLQNCQTPPRINTKRHRLALGRRPTNSLRRTKNSHVHQSGAHPTRLRQTILPPNRRICLRRGSRTLARGRINTLLSQTPKTNPPPYILLFSHLHPHRTKLRHLRKGTPSNYEISGSLASLPRMDQTSLPDPHRSRQPTILEIPQELESTNGQVARRPPRIRLRDQTRAGKNQHPSRRPITTP